MDAYHANILDNSKQGYDNQYNYDRYEETRRQNNLCGGTVDAQRNNITASNTRIETWLQKQGTKVQYAELIIDKSTGQPVGNPLPPPQPKAPAKTTKQLLAELKGMKFQDPVEMPSEKKEEKKVVMEGLKSRKVLLRTTNFYTDGTFEDIYTRPAVQYVATVGQATHLPPPAQSPYIPRRGNVVSHNGKIYKSVANAARETGLKTYWVKHNADRNIKGWCWL